MSVMPQPEHAAGVSSVTVIFPQALQCHAGMRWPHQSWRLMHQSCRVFRSDVGDAAAGARSGRVECDGDLSAGLAVPCWNAMAPPELAADAPVVQVIHPLEVGFGIHLRRELDMAVAHG